MGRSLTGLVTSLFAASTLAVAPGCNKVGQWLDEDSPGSSNLKDNPLAPALETLDTKIRNVGGTITYYRGSDGKLYVENVTLPDSCNGAKDSPQTPKDPKDVPGPAPGPANIAVPALVDRGMTQGESNYDDAKAALTDDKRNIHTRVETHKKGEPQFSTRTTTDPETIICYVPSPPGKPKEPEKPKAPPEGCPYTIWKEFPRPSRQDIIDDIFNVLLRGKTITGIDALTAISAYNLYSQLAAKFIGENDDAIDGAISERVGEVRFYDSLRERSETRDVSGVSVKVGYSVQGDTYSANGTDFASRVKIDEINDSNVRAGIKGKVIAALKGGALRFYQNHFYHKDNFNTEGIPTASPATAVTIPSSNYAKKSLQYAAQDRTVLDTTSPLCKPQSVDPTSIPLDQCGVGTNPACYTDQVK